MWVLVDQHLCATSVERIIAAIWAVVVAIGCTAAVAILVCVDLVGEVCMEAPWEAHLCVRRPRSLPLLARSVKLMMAVGESRHQLAAKPKDGTLRRVLLWLIVRGRVFGYRGDRRGRKDFSRAPGSRLAPRRGAALVPGEAARETAVWYFSE